MQHSSCNIRVPVLIVDFNMRTRCLSPESGRAGLRDPLSPQHSWNPSHTQTAHSHWSAYWLALIPLLYHPTDFFRPHYDETCRMQPGAHAFRRRCCACWAILGFRGCYFRRTKHTDFSQTYMIDLPWYDACSICDHLMVILVADACIFKKKKRN